MRFVSVILIFFFPYASFSENQVHIIESKTQKCIISNGFPNHKIGEFPNKHNPNSFKTQKLKFCFTKIPKKNISYTNRAKIIGVTITGIPIRPETADWYDASAPRQHSKNKSSGWNLEAITPNNKLFGLDVNNGHVDNKGLYHYHGIPKVDLNNHIENSLIGYAADGYEIHYLGSEIKSSWILKKGHRKTKPYGEYDGSFFQDYTYLEGLGNLDECNGGILNLKYVYFATDTFPFFPRCHWGSISNYFTR